MKVQDTYKEPILIQTENVNARVFVPELSEEERERRMKAVYKAVENVFLYKA